VQINYLKNIFDGLIKEETDSLSVTSGLLMIVKYSNFMKNLTNLEIKNITGTKI
jgi:hypothetical protein